MNKENQNLQNSHFNWDILLKEEFSKDYMKNLSEFISKRRTETIVYPPSNEVFNAYKLTPYDKVNVCIVGQDPYINPFEAMGLCFSTFNGQYTPSLRRIEKAIRQQVYNNDSEYKWNNNLTRWAEQGVFLLNRVLTVDSGKSNSHKGKGWEEFTLRTIQELDKKGIIFLLWGNDAKTLTKHINNSKVIEAEHPIAGAYKGKPWDNNDCFNKVNEIITNKIKW